MGMAQMTQPTREFVGREQELAYLLARFEDARGGREAVVTVTGDFGIGKTRLVAEFGRLVQARGGTFAVGGCLEYLQAPYVPFVEAFRALLLKEERPTSRSRALRSLISDYTADVASTGAAGDQRRKLQLFDEALECLRQTAARRPLAIVIEDIHWADAATLDLLEFVAKNIAGQRILLMATCRKESTEAVHTLGRILGKIARGGGSSLHVSGLSNGDVRYLMNRASPEGTLPVETLDRIETLAEGNPLFLEELLRAVLDGVLDPFEAKSGAPLSIRATVQERIASFDPDAREILLKAAIIGRDFDARFLARICEKPTAVVLKALRSARDRQLITSSGPADRFIFRHAMVREALYNELLAPERRELHARIATELETLSRVPHQAAALAYHWSAADMPAKALKYNEAAGDNAAAFGAFRDAARFYQRALDFHARSGAKRAVLCEKLAMALSFGGFSEHARAWFEQALEEYRKREDVAKMVDVLLCLSAQYWVNANTEEALQMSIRVLELPSLSANDPLRFNAAIMSATYCALLGRMHEAQSYLGMADAVACDRSPGYIARFHDVRGVVMDSLGRTAEARSDFETALDIATELDDADLIARVASNYADFAIGLSDWELAERCWQRAIESAEKKEYVWQAAFSSLSYAWLKLQRGELHEARRLLLGGLAAGEEAKLARILETAAGIPIGLMLEDEELVRRCTHEDALELAVGSGEAQHIGGVALALAELYREHGRDGEVRALLHRAVTVLPSADQAEAMLLHVALYADPEDVPRARDLLRSWAHEDHLVARAFLLAFDATAEGSADDGLRAVQAFTQIRMPYYEARSLEIVGAADEAEKIYSRIGSVRDVRRVDNARRMARRQRKTGSLLTDREREIAILAAQGHSNREIADELAISKRTVDHHVESILSRLGLRSRFQLTQVLSASS
jgi:DNA-binding CsgD family transcriptional regulator